MQLDRCDREDEQAEASIAEDPLDPVERDRPDDERDDDDCDEDQPAVRETREEPEADRQAADLGRERHQVHDLGGDQRREAGREPHPFAYGVEHGLLRDRRDASAHLRVHDDADDADHDDPEELVSEGRSGGDVEDEVADVDEAADRREDAERDLEDLHAQSPSCSSRPLTSAALSASLASSWWRRSATRPAFSASLRTALSMPGVVGRCESASSKLEARVASSPA